MRSIIWFEEAGADDLSLVGGKGANLARLTTAGFVVPTGFIVTTDAYFAFVDTLQARIQAAISGIDFSAHDAVETATTGVRQMIRDAALPADIAQEIKAAYARLSGGNAYVAVRSSGTAEDLAEASFAGMHDTFLDVRGAEAVLNAVKDCWASMWSARATAYRQDRGINHAQARIAAVIQTMVESEVAGVLFTGNPLTTATDEFVINASWGLGEAVVSGFVSPDQFVIAADDLRIKRRERGAKEKQVIRDPVHGHGTLTQETPATDRERYCLTPEQVADIALLGRRVMDYYGGLPQDIEWALQDGRVHLLQARPVTGVEFSWDAEVSADAEVWCDFESADDAIWTRAWADEAWTGPTTPLFYSLRMQALAIPESKANQLRGLHKASRMRYMTFHKAKVYFNTELHRETLTNTSLPFMRPGQQADWLPPAWREEAIATPLSMGDYLKIVARMNLFSGKQDLIRWRHEMQSFIDDPEWHPDALPNLELLSDDRLINLVEKLMRREQDFCARTWFAWVQYPRDIMAWITLMLSSWYDGEHPEMLGDLFAGSIRQSKTQLENIELSAVTRIIAESPSLRELFALKQGPAFFAACEDTEEGQAFLRQYIAFRDKWFFRGHEDRDVSFVRRGEDPWIDYRTMQTLLSAESGLDDSEAREHAVSARRAAAIDEVVANFRHQPLGGLRAELFKIAVYYFHDWLVLRDDERWSTDRTTMCERLVMQEYGRRLKVRGLIERDDDYYFLTLPEIKKLGASNKSTPLMRAKIKARRRDFERLHRRQVDPPMWLQYGQGVDLDTPMEGDSDRLLNGLPTSSGIATGPARIVSRVQDIGTVRKGDILVCNSTDPGWTPVFSVVAGIITETGGILAHASCLSREYGLPAVQIPGAMKKISDGALITVNGSTGQVILGDESNPD